MDKKLLRFYGGSLNIIRKYFPVPSKIHQLLIEVCNEVQQEWEKAT